MALIVFFNDLSALEGGTPAAVARDAMTSLARIIGGVRRRRPDAIFQCQEPLRTWRLGDGYTVAQWLNDPACRDEWRVILSAQDRSPLRFGLDPGFADENGLEYRHRGRKAAALGLADLFGGLAISFAGADWGDAFVKVERAAIEENDAGEVTLELANILVSHVSLNEHFLAHEEWLKTAGWSEIISFDDFEAQRRDRFPNLDFLAQAMDQIRAIDPSQPWWGAVMKRLHELQQCVGEWDPNQTPTPTWRTLTTPEHEGRKRLCEFEDLDGVVRCFDWHSRFTPGSGRLYFRLDGTTRRARVAHIGIKLG